MNRKQCRQGDVLLIPVEALPAGTIEESADGRVVLAYGEVTGHAHAIDAALAKTYEKGAERYVVVSEGAVLRHEEHSPIKLAPGVYKVQLQREYEPEGFRRVTD
jgi:hypothetical protein